MLYAGVKEISCLRQDEIKATKARLVRNAELHLRAKGEAIDTVKTNLSYDNCLRGQLLVGHSLDRLRISVKLGIGYWRYGRDQREEVYQDDARTTENRWMAPQYVDMIARDGNGAMLSTMSQRGFGIDLGHLQQYCSSAASHHLDQYYISTQAECGSLPPRITSSSLPASEPRQIEGSSPMLRLECKDEPVVEEESTEACASSWEGECVSTEEMGEFLKEVREIIGQAQDGSDEVYDSPEDACDKAEESHENSAEACDPTDEASEFLREVRDSIEEACVRLNRAHADKPTRAQRKAEKKRARAEKKRAREVA